MWIKALFTKHKVKMSVMFKQVHNKQKEGKKHVYENNNKIRAVRGALTCIHMKI